MSSVDDRLRVIEDQKKKQDADESERYNRYIDELNKLIPKITKEIENNPPNGYHWISIDSESKKIAAWGFSFNKHWDDSGCCGFCVSSNGQIIFDDDVKLSYAKLHKIENVDDRPKYSHTTGVNKYAQTTLIPIDSDYLSGVIRMLNHFYDCIIGPRQPPF